MVSSTLEWLRARLNTGQASDRDVHEYRLLLSGCAYNGDLEGDPFRSEGGRILAEEPCMIWCASRPLDSYPQEISVSVQVSDLALRGVSKDGGDVGVVLEPHEDVVSDLAALLTLYLRRLVAVVGEVGVTFPSTERPIIAPSPYPMPICTKSRAAIVWPRLPLVTWNGGESSTYSDPNPPPIPVSPSSLRDFFSKVASHSNADAVVNAAKIYHRAMELFFSHTDVSYLLLVCAAEAVAQCVYRKSLSIEDRLAEPAPKQLSEQAEHFGLSSEQARQLAEIAAELLDKQGATKKFVDFLSCYGAGHAAAPALLNKSVLEMKLSSVPDEKAAFRKIYGARSNFVHSAKPFQRSALTGTTHGVHVMAVHEMLVGENKVPTILWLERLVSHSIRAYIDGPLT
jgi:hypothetical protein